MEEDGIHVMLKRKMLSIHHPYWRIELQSRDGHPHPGQVRLDIVIKPMYDVDDDIVAPHGILGQTFDRSHCPNVNGKVDDYSHAIADCSLIHFAAQLLIPECN